MSLKQFHIVFIVMALLLTAGFSGWAFTRIQADTGVMMMGGTSAAMTLGLIVYGLWFFRKWKGQMDS